MLSLRRARSIETEAGAKKEFKVPHTLVIISFILVIVAVATWILPAGMYERVVNDLGRTVVVDHRSNTSSNHRKDYLVYYKLH